MKIIELLRAIPIWNDLVKLPARVEELEKRLALLELSDTSLDACPACKKPSFKLISSKPNAIFGDTGSIDRLYECQSCNYSETKMID